MSRTKKKRPKQAQRIAKKVKEVQKQAESTKPNATITRAISDAFRRWREDKVQLSVLAAELNVKRSKLRRSFQQLAGGKDKFRALRSEGAGGTTEPFGGKRATGGRTKAVIALDDSKVPVIPHCRKSDGWTHRELFRRRIVNIKNVGTVNTSETQAVIFTSPEGVDYVRATPTERADLIVQSGGFPAIRLRKYETSGTKKAISHDEKEVERGKIALERTRKRKRDAKASRRSADV